MEKLYISGGARLQGRVRASGAKNAVLPIMAACLLTESPCRLVDVPKLDDVQTMKNVLEVLGAETAWENDSLIIKVANIRQVEAPYYLVCQMRASFLAMGPLVARTGMARLPLPGGCAIGTRPVDLHLKGLSALGAVVTYNHGFMEVKAPRLTGNRIYLDYPSVGATENVMMAACLARGTTLLENAAEEPEVVDLANFLNSLGANVIGAGTSVIKIEGVKTLRGAEHTIIPDRIEIGTFMVASAVTAGDIVIDNVLTEHIKPVIAKLKEAQVTIDEGDSSIRVRGPEEIRAVALKTLPYPGFPTDLQAPIIAMLTLASGTSVITENVFENRFMHVDELCRMGANIKVEGPTAIIKGVPSLKAAQVRASDLRAAAALVIAGLAAHGTTEISALHHLDRGYQGMEAKLASLGALIQRKHISDMD